MADFSLSPIIILKKAMTKFHFHFQHCLLGKHIVIEIDQERLKNMHRQMLCLGMVLKWFDRNFDSRLRIMHGYHRPLGMCGWKNEKSLICSVVVVGCVYQ